MSNYWFSHIDWFLLISVGCIDAIINILFLFLFYHLVFVSLLYKKKKIPCCRASVLSVIDHRRRQNVIRISERHHFTDVYGLLWDIVRKPEILLLYLLLLYYYYWCFYRKTKWMLFLCVIREKQKLWLNFSKSFLKQKLGWACHARWLD